MRNMRRGFTLIELVFVIVIIGILAAVAIPRFASTRDDASASKLVNNLATCINDAGSWYIRYAGFTGGDNGSPAIGGLNSTACTTGLNTDEATPIACFTPSGVNGTGVLTIAAAGAGNTACDIAHLISTTNKTTGTHQF